MRLFQLKILVFVFMMDTCPFSLIFLKLAESTNMACRNFTLLSSLLASTRVEMRSYLLLGFPLILVPSYSLYIRSESCLTKLHQTAICSIHATWDLSTLVFVQERSDRHCAYVSTLVEHRSLFLIGAVVNGDMEICPGASPWCETLDWNGRGYESRTLSL